MSYMYPPCPPPSSSPSLECYQPSPTCPPHGHQSPNNPHYPYTPPDPITGFPSSYQDPDIRLLDHGSWRNDLTPPPGYWMSPHGDLRHGAPPRYRPLPHPVLHPDFLQDFQPGPDLHPCIELSELNMENHTLDGMTDWSELQGEEDVYQPHYTGPLISELRSTTEIQQEYSGADVSFSRKAANLALTYGSYRKVRGDGSCGPRALLFGYFESMAKYADVAKLQAERGRLQGYDWKIEEHVYINDYALDLITPIFNGLIAAIHRDPAARVQLVLDTFNERPELSHYARMLTAVQIKENALFFNDFLEDMTPDAFSAEVTRPDAEYDQTAVTALASVLLKPADMALNILNLNRNSTSDHVDNVSYYQGREAMPVDTIYMLYRPGHYDLVYATDTTMIINSGMNNLDLTNQPLEVSQSEMSDATLPSDVGPGSSAPRPMTLPDSSPRSPSQSEMLDSTLPTCPFEAIIKSAMLNGTWPSRVGPDVCTSDHNSEAFVSDNAAIVAQIESMVKLPEKPRLPSDMPPGLRNTLELILPLIGDKNKFHSRKNRAHRCNKAFQPIALQSDDWEYILRHSEFQPADPLQPGDSMLFLSKKDRENRKRASGPVPAMRWSEQNQKCRETFWILD